MNKRFFFTCAMMALMLGGADAQSKLSLSTQMLLSKQKAGTSMKHEAKASQISQTILTTIMLEKGSNVTDQQLAALGIKVESRRGTMIFATVPVDKLTALSEIEGVRMVDTGAMRKPQNDLSREASSVNQVHDMSVMNSMTDLPGQYRGKDVLVAIIDTDIDLAHPAFRNAEGKPRFKQAVAFIPNEEEQSVELHTYGEDEMDRAIEETKDMKLIGGGHGTHVASIAAGSTVVLGDDDPLKNFYGMAPEADLLAYDVIGNDSELLYSLNDAFSKADELQRPLVVNISMGSNSARLDGTDSFNEALRELFSQYDMTGKFVCVSAGNEGKYNLSVQLDCNQPIENNDWTIQHTLVCTSMDVLANKEEGSEPSYLSSAGFTFYAADERDYFVKYAFYDKVTNEFIAETPEFKTNECTEVVTIDNAGTTDSGITWKYEFKAASEITSANRNYMDCIFEAYFSTRVSTVVYVGTRSEGMHIDGSVVGYSTHAVAFNNNASGVTAEANSWGSINVMACNDCVLGIGAYCTRHEVLQDDGFPAFDNYEVVGDIAKFSSYCHPHYGKQNPVVAAPGTLILSAVHHGPGAGGSWPGGVTPYDGVDYPWTYMQGTSMSSPAAAGIIALWLQANPELTREDILDILASTSDYDEFCEAAPLRFGAGKINAKRGIDYILDKTVGVTPVANSADLQPAKYIDANGRIMIRKGEHSYDVMGVERR